jgi:hypothetical protein
VITRAYVKRYFLRFVIHAAVTLESNVNDSRYLQLNERAYKGKGSLLSLIYDIG